MPNETLYGKVIIVVLVVGSAFYLYSKFMSQGDTAKHNASQLKQSILVEKSPVVYDAKNKALFDSLKALLYADQSLKDELVSMAEFVPELNRVLGLVNSGQCDEALRIADAKVLAPPPEGYAVLLAAYARQACGDRAGAAEALQTFLASVRGASHPTLQTWCRLRELGVNPSLTEAHDVLGLIVEIGHADGIDTIAAYADGTSRYFSRQGGGILGRETRPDVQDAARRVISAAQTFVGSAHQEIDQKLASDGIVRFTFLMPGGPLVTTVPSEALKSAGCELLPLFAPAAELLALKVQPL